MSALHRRTLLRTGLALAAAPALLPRRARAARKFKIALSNSYIGNKWRIEMENLFK